MSKEYRQKVLITGSWQPSQYRTTI